MSSIGDSPSMEQSQASEQSLPAHMETEESKIAREVRDLDLENEPSFENTDEFNEESTRRRGWSFSSSSTFGSTSSSEEGLAPAASYIKQTVSSIEEYDLEKISLGLDKQLLLMKRGVMGEVIEMRRQFQIRLQQALAQEKKNYDERIQKKNAEVEDLIASHTKQIATIKRNRVLITRMAYSIASKTLSGKDSLLLKTAMSHWRRYINHCKTAKQKDYIARKHWQTYSQKKAFAAWHLNITRSSKVSREREYDTKINEMSGRIIQSYEDELLRLRNELALAHNELQRKAEQQTRLEEDMKRAFMRGMCALNLEAMSVLKPTISGENETEKNDPQNVSTMQADPVGVPVSNVRITPALEERNLVTPRITPSQMDEIRPLHTKITGVEEKHFQPKVTSNNLVDTNNNNTSFNTSFNINNNNNPPLPNVHIPIPQASPIYPTTASKPTVRISSEPLSERSINIAPESVNTSFTKQYKIAQNNNNLPPSQYPSHSHPPHPQYIAKTTGSGQTPRNNVIVTRHKPGTSGTSTPSLSSNTVPLSTPLISIPPSMSSNINTSIHTHSHSHSSTLYSQPPLVHERPPMPLPSSRRVKK
eukprot:TRINITY_DN4427_c0_g1_i1.p1 TRINITY_DN4427_c0_g1~~TRINITY_DN4427_c0_g1_i1.p1  ORF type:complete len:590 (-),score=144.58 TRINITY_DN4427_c0_g1_i1:136-1905(-)